eukprot:CAMPEP_0201177878 /NCGR_PEP_ID=MMETSP0851-20130426/108930_1 /ASSEMBLY_ACC=CAM_ASM_000631 /TAXON_ID=183588 /ORGANISM="Pseudo-nitzschia fraudulenta, Strain WWA7" /LENGTH=417 /DNA_ID=CAMNT_0047461563 /DNA_START=26 /DNA_END=1279 /DNA_ORIENTATION=+
MTVFEKTNSAMVPLFRKTNIFAFLLTFLIASGFTERNGSPYTGGLSCEAKKFAPVVSNGLKNAGNTCYMNAQIQCAFHIPAVREIAASISSAEPLPSNDSDDETPEESSAEQEELTDAALALKEVFEGMIRASHQNSFSYMPVSFCRRLGIPPMVQQDSQEFWKLLLPAVGVGKLSDLYKGAYEDYITAIDGSEREKRRNEVFSDLSLDVATRSTLFDSLKDTFGEPELLDVAEGNGWRPEKGADKVNAHKGSSLLAKGLPPILQFHLKRFNYDWNTDSTTKLNNQFTFPKSIDLAPICIDAEENDSRSEYELQSVIIHMGEFDMGHYYAYVRPDIKSNKWYRFNDDSVDEVSFEDVTTDAFGGMQNRGGNQGGGILRRVRRLFQNKENSFGWGGRTSNAYVVQYVQRDSIQSLYSV